MPTITATISAETTTPDLILPWSTSQQTKTILQEIIGSSDPWVSMSAAQSREGTLDLFYTVEADADAARVLLASVDSFTIDYAARPSLEFTFVVVGTIQVDLDSNTADHWVVRFTYRELST